MKPICVPCRRFYRPIHNGEVFIEGMPTDSNARPGTGEPDKWKPYKLWNGDLWRCPTCGHETIAGVNQTPLGEHYEPDFGDKAKRYGATIQINDC